MSLRGVSLRGVSPLVPEQSRWLDLDAGVARGWAKEGARISHYRGWFAEVRVGKGGWSLMALHVLGAHERRCSAGTGAASGPQQPWLGPPRERRCEDGFACGHVGRRAPQWSGLSTRKNLRGTGGARTDGHGRARTDTTDTTETTNTTHPPTKTNSGVVVHERSRRWGGGAPCSDAQGGRPSRTSVGSAAALPRWHRAVGR